jgi:hypothetical protein
MNRNFYQQSHRPGSVHSRDSARSHQFKPRGQRGRPIYTNVYQQSATNFYNNQVNRKYNNPHARNGNTSIDSQRSIGTYSQRRPMSNQRNILAGNSVPRIPGSRMRSNSRLNNAQPKNMIDTLKRRLPFQQSRSHSRNFVTEVKRPNRVSIDKNLDDNDKDRINGNTFINIPKVKAPVFQEKKNRFKPRNKNRKKKGEKNTLKDKLKILQNTQSIRQNPIKGKNILRTKNRLVSKNNFNVNHRSRQMEIQPQSQEQLSDLRKYNRIQKEVKMKRLFQKTMTLDENNKLRENIFDSQNNYQRNFVLSPRSKLQMQNNSRLEYLFDSKPRPKKTVKRESSGFNMMAEMGSRYNNSFQTDDTQTSRTSLLKKGYSLKENQPKIKVKDLLHHEARIDKQLKNISLKELKKEMNQYMKNPNRNTLIQTILSQNKELENLKIDLFELEKNDSRQLYKELERKQQQLQKRQKELWKIVEELRNSGQIVGPSLMEKHQRLSFEQSLKPNELKTREKKVSTLKKMDLRCQELDKKLQNFDNEMEEKFQKIMAKRKDMILSEENDLLELLDDNDETDQILIQEMDRMIKNLVK